MVSLKDRLKEILIKNSFIDPQNLELALQEQKKSGEELGKILIKRSFIDESTLSQALSQSFDLPVIKLARFKIDPSVIKIISREVAEQFNILPVSLMGNNLTLAMADPLNIFAIDNINTLTGYAINPVIATKSEIEQYVEKYYSQEALNESSETFDEIIKDIHEAEDLEIVKDAPGESPQTAVEQLSQEAPIIKLTDMIIQQAVLAKASDVFIEPLEKTVRVRYRIDGIIQEIDRMAKMLHNPIVSRIKVISNLDISEHRLPQDGRFKTITSGGKEVDFRVNVLSTAFGEKVVLRVLDQGGAILNLDNLGFEPDQLKRLQECALKPHGLILACGPTGSGKTTTLYSMLQHVNSPQKNIVTVEDPVEYQLKGINQVNVKPAVGLTFAASLRSILRQDPDVILIGEIRDSETLDIAVKAALTGHLVLSSLHTTTAAGSVIRMMNMGVEPFLICSSVLVIIAQRLIRKICPHCQGSYVVPRPVAEQVGLTHILPDPKIELFRGKGCNQCFNTGYRGRIGITEVCLFTPKVKEVLLQRAGEANIKRVARKEGMKTMREDGLYKALAGLTTLEEVLRVTAPDEDK